MGEKFEKMKCRNGRRLRAIYGKKAESVGREAIFWLDCRQAIFVSYAFDEPGRRAFATRAGSRSVCNAGNISSFCPPIPLFPYFT
jgi:hypothetical protein